MLSRRAVLSGVAASAATLAFPKPNPPKKMIYPQRLKLGDTVSIVAPAGRAGQEAIEKAKKNVESLGFKVKLGVNLGERWGYLAGTDQQRADDFNAAVCDPEVDGIVCLRGGYGTMRMLPLIDYNAFKKHPKVVMGYSDITGILNALTRKCGVVTYHGPIAEANFEGFEGEQMRRAIVDGFSLDEFPTPSNLLGKEVYPAARTIQSGTAKGRLIGGNLSLIQPCAGSPFGPDFKDAILFLEDVAESPTGSIEC